MTRVGGVIAHISAVSGYYGRGYYNVHPLLLEDFYLANGCDFALATYRPRARRRGLSGYFARAGRRENVVSRSESAGRVYLQGSTRHRITFGPRYREPEEPALVPNNVLGVFIFTKRQAQSDSDAAAVDSVRRIRTRQVIKRAILAGFRSLGYVPIRLEAVAADAPGVREVPEDFTEDEKARYRAVEQYTMTTPERVQALLAATQYVVESGLGGAFVECGVWRGGSMMAVARMLRELGVEDRDLYLFDTFTGMTEPTAVDVMRATGDSAAELLAGHGRDSRVWAVSALEEVKANMASVGYDEAYIHYIDGDVVETIPERAPDKIALLRLDTDWYKSTKHELTHLYPRVSPGGIVILDDYGHWGGARQAVDEYIAERQLTLLLQRIDVTGRLAQKPR